MHIGLIGGIGPAATLVYYSALSRLAADAGRRLHLTIANADTQEMVGNLQAGNREAQALIFAGYVDQLKAGGCEAAALTSMGGHFCVNELKAISSLPIVNAVPAMDACFAERRFKRVGVLGTRAVMESGIYGVSSAEILIPTAEELPEVQAQYFSIAASARATQQEIAFFQAAGAKLIERGADVVLLGGTDLSVAFASDPGYPILDSAMIHAQAIASVALDEVPPSAFY